MRVLSQLSVLVLVFVGPICTSDSCRATDSLLFHLRGEILRKSMFGSVGLLARVHSLPLFKSDRIILLQKRLMCHPLLAASPLVVQVVHQNKGKGYCGCVWLCTSVCVCVLRVGGFCVKEEVLSGTEAFCRCCREEGLNGNFCGYQPRGSTLWLEKVCHVWPPSQTLRCLFALADGGTEKLVVPSDRGVWNVWAKGSNGRCREKEKEEKHVY